MTRTSWAGLLMAVVLALGGCGQRVIDSNVTVFHSLPASVDGKTVAVVAFPPELNDSIEFKTYRPVVERHLIEAGFEIVSRDNAEYIALFSFGSALGAPGQIASLAVANDVDGAVGYRPAEVSASDGATRQSPFSISRFETVEHRRGSGSDAVYARNVALDLVPGPSFGSDEGRKVYKARAVSIGSCAGTPEMVKNMVAAIFEGFPGRSGTSRVVRMPAGAACRGSRL